MMYVIIFSVIAAVVVAYHLKLTKKAAEKIEAESKVEAVQDDCACESCVCEDGPLAAVMEEEVKINVETIPQEIIIEVKEEELIEKPVQAIKTVKTTKHYAKKPTAKSKKPAPKITKVTDKKGKKPTGKKK